MQIEDAVNKISLPVNTIAILKRGIEILEEYKTNSFKNLTGESRIKYRKIMWLLCNQVYDAEMNLTEEWNVLVEGGD